MIELTDVSLSSHTRQLLSQFSLVLPDPGIYLIAGPTASGKSLLCKLITGRIRPAHGSVRIDGSRPRHGLTGPAGEFYSEAGQLETWDESVREYLVAELAAAGVSPRSAADYFGLLDSYFPDGIATPVPELSCGEGLILQCVLAAAAPGRTAVLDGHLNFWSEAAATYCWQILQRSLVDHEKFIILTANSTRAYLEGEVTTIRLAGGLPVTTAI